MYSHAHTHTDNSTMHEGIWTLAFPFWLLYLENNWYPNNHIYITLFIYISDFNIYILSSDNQSTCHVNIKTGVCLSRTHLISGGRFGTSVISDLKKQRSRIPGASWLAILVILLYSIEKPCLPWWLSDQGRFPASILGMCMHIFYVHRCIHMRPHTCKHVHHADLF